MRIFLIVSLFFLNSVLADNKSQNSKTSTGIDSSSGEIYLSVDGKRFKSAKLSPDKIKFEYNFNLIETEGLTKEEIATANILNMRKKWIDGERYITIDGQKYPITLKESMQAMKYLNYQTIKELSKKNPKIKLDKYSPELTKEEIKEIDSFTNKIQTAVQDLTDTKILGLESRTVPKGFENDYTRMADAIQKLTSTSSLVVLTMLDGRPHILGSTGNPIESMSPNNNYTLYLRTPSANLRCPGMSQSQPPSGTGSLLKIDFNFSPFTDATYTCNPAECVVLVNTPNTAPCNYSADRIQQTGFELGDR